MDVTIYTKNGCQQCKATKRRLDRRGIAYQEIDLDTDPWARIQVRQLGYQSAPVVDTPHGAWAGYRPTLIDRI
ncbi:MULTISPECIES: glutaredoxin domain-containing protein [Bifidobacterium]|jgi:glutaredoxin-like protein NrdH|uniref:Glutaredoxin n=2 Tax=Bifidobacterium TaxID=1678 RepID=A0A087DTI7_9BIFI|nr:MULTISPECIES: glutaredoxin domain-containing protein [Bifidobacterium]KAE8128706.1 NrdH-redoxin [Bifidobacterium tibiigranuli]KAE8128897.1 NrdH-redoxin [Bifidobacterium tibiigranuli]KFI98837.1 glutaredoxin [Bifidobacterium subtile]MCH3973499.1 NrdH-redoxin [Bifidobacterium tibiigranuli]QOL36472.1 NrdH-redoxin [Bifidobacterium subtile]